MTWVILPIQILSALALLFLVLLHSGKGGGMSDLLGGGSAASAAAGSTVMERNLDRLTIIVALVFTFSTMTLALVIDL
ncbi:MAG: preprotein translocase subunit SecG [Acidimicrobiia bacterium]